MWIDRRFLAGIAALSLLGNVFLVGLLVGGLSPVRHAAKHVEPFFGGTFVRPADVRLLPADQREQFGAAMKAHRPAIRDARRIVRDRRREAEADIAAPAFDRAKVMDDLARLRTANAALLVELHAGLADALAVLPVESRATLAQPRRPGGPEAAPPAAPHADGGSATPPKADEPLR